MFIFSFKILKCYLQLNFCIPYHACMKLVMKFKSFLEIYSITINNDRVYWIHCSHSHEYKLVG